MFMNKNYVSILLLALTCLFSFLGCDAEKSDNTQSPVLMLALTTSDIEITGYDPFMTENNVDPSRNITITFSGSLDITTKGVVQLGPVEFIDGDNCTINFDTDTNTNDQIIIDPNDPLSPTVYYGLRISGFKDAAGKNVRLETIYNFQVAL